MSWTWVRPDALVSIHREQLAEHGGAEGVRDQGLLESALARPENIAAYEDPSAFELAAAYAYGVIRNHPFVDGNKRTAYLSTYVFLGLNRWELDADEAEAAAIMIDLAAGDVSEEEFALWLKANARKAT